ncbi:MAG: GTPase HflX [Alphaproteobacteria bacterium]|nr:GTPase HflX [Alphaproteobacteria bacterium]
MTNRSTDAGGIRALVVHPALRGARSSSRSLEARLAEAQGLAEAIALTVVHGDLRRIARPVPATLFGRGVVKEIADIVELEDVALVVVDGALSPIQQRNLERAWACKVIDRTALILEIFGRRARTREGTLQVELAHLTYQRSRLVRSWTHLERQRGGFGFLGGPGESQLEIDRRLIDERLTKLKRELETVRRRRGLQRRARRRVPFPVVALVGYTNAGKSTLFNRLTKAKVAAEDKLFATLDPTMRAVDLPSGQRVILSDTVGFISDLPTHLVAAFRATLEEVTDAQVLLHVRDVSHPDHDAQKADVLTVLETLGLGGRLEGNTIEALNKIDLLNDEDREALATQAARSNQPAVPVSAKTGQGLERLLDMLDQRLAQNRVAVGYRLDIGDGAALSWLYEYGEVIERHDEDAVIALKVRLDPKDAARFEKRFAADRVE